MPAYRFFTDSPLKPNEFVTLKDFEHKHAKQVMRCAIGDTLEMTNGQGDLAKATIVEQNKLYSTLQLTSVQHVKKTHELILIQAMTKMNKLEQIIEKGTELGLTQLFLFPGEKSVQKILTEKLERFEKLSISALKQCGRLYLPEIHILGPMSSWNLNYFKIFFGHLEPDAPQLIKSLSQSNHLSDIVFINGPEAGFSDSELALMQKAGYTGTRLHYNILRAETAALTFLSQGAQHLALNTNGTVIN